MSRMRSAAVVSVQPVGGDPPFAHPDAVGLEDGTAA